MKGGVYYYLSYDELNCPITNEIMKKPVIASDGFTYEKQAIKKHMQNSQKSPKTGKILSSKLLIPDRKMKQAISEYICQTKYLHQELFSIKKIDKNIGNKNALKIQSVYRKLYAKRFHAATKIMQIYKAYKHKPYLEYLKNLDDIEELDFRFDENSIWKNMPDTLKNDRSLVLEAAKINGEILNYVNPMFLADKEIVLHAVYSNLSIFCELPDRFYDDPCIVTQALIGNYGCNEILEDYEVFQSCSNRLKNDREFILRKLVQDVCKEHEGQPSELILQGMPEKFFKDPEVLVKILEGFKYKIDKCEAITELLSQWEKKIDRGNVNHEELRGGSFWSYYNITNFDEFWIDDDEIEDNNVYLYRGRWDPIYDLVIRKLKLSHRKKMLKEYTLKIGKTAKQSQRKLHLISGIPSDISRKISSFALF